MGIRQWVAVTAFAALAMGFAGGVESRAADTPAAPAGAEKTDTSGLLEAKPFTDRVTGITLNLPKGWVPKDGVQHTGYQSATMDSDETGSLAVNVVFSSAKMPGMKETDFPDQIKLAKEALTKQLDGYKEFKDDSKVQIDGKPTVVLAYSFVVGKEVKVEQRQFWVLSNGNIYIITFASLQSTFEKNRPLMDALIKTIKVPG